MYAAKNQLTKNQSAASHVAQRKPNHTGLPDRLKSSIEGMSGYSMDDVKVHYNSSKPAQLQAHAFAQGNQIHLSPGQEKHLPHEAWHVVQQKQGRVKPTFQMKSTVPVNDDAGLEKEADVMGGRASNYPAVSQRVRHAESSNSTIQLMFDFSAISNEILYLGLSLTFIASIAMYYGYNKIKEAVLSCYRNGLRGREAFQEALDSEDDFSGSDDFTGHSEEEAVGVDEKSTDEGPRRSLRKRKGTGVGALDRYMFGRPIYRGTSYGGGTHSSFKLGPNSFQSMGSDADPSKPGVIKKARTDLGIAFKAGHLLNADFFGDGKDSKNLTPLSPSGNSNHKNFDNPIKIAAGILKEIYNELQRNYEDVTTLNLGIQLDIKTSDGKWSHKSPGSYIAKSLICTAKVSGKLTSSQMALVADLYKLMLSHIKEAEQHISNPGY